MKRVLVGLIFAAIYCEGVYASQNVNYGEIVHKRMRKEFDESTKLVITSDLLKNLKLENGDFRI